jgi:hypothetical protein
MALVLCAVWWASPALAQVPAASDPNPGNITITGSFDVVSTYVFRGIRSTPPESLCGPSPTWGSVSTLAMAA